MSPDDSLMPPPMCMQVPRTFHHGVVGTFMSPALHDRFFAHVDYSTDADVTWPSSRWIDAITVSGKSGEVWAVARATSPASRAD